MSKLPFLDNTFENCQSNKSLAEIQEFITTKVCLVMQQYEVLVLKTTTRRLDKIPPPKQSSMNEYMSTKLL